MFHNEQHTDNLRRTKQGHQSVCMVLLGGNFGKGVINANNDLLRRPDAQSDHLTIFRELT